MLLHAIPVMLFFSMTEVPIFKATLQLVVLQPLVAHVAGALEALYVMAAAAASW